MKRTASIITIGTSALLLTALVTPIANAESSRTEIRQNTTGSTKTCINGECTTTEGTSQSEVCVDGKCFTTENGNVDYQSEDGKTKIKINNNSGDSEVSVQNKAAGETIVEKDPTATPKPTVEVEKDVQGIADDKIEKAKAEAEKKLQELKTKEFDILSFLKAELESVKGFFGMFGLNL